MPADYALILKQIGKQYGKRISSTNLFDANVCTSPFDRDRPWKILALPGDMFRHKLNLTFDSHRVQLLANGYFIAATVIENLDVDVCSINRPDKVFFLERRTLTTRSSPSYPVFSRQSASKLLKFLNSAALKRMLDTLQLAAHESIHLYHNGITLYLCRDSVEGVVKAVSAACQLAGELRMGGTD